LFFGGAAQNHLAFQTPKPSALSFGRPFNIRAAEKQKERW
jgi:hypothetical protein